MKLTQKEKEGIVRGEGRSGRVFAFVAVPFGANGEFALGVAVLGEAGYDRTQVPQSFSTYEAASAQADEYNAMLGLDESTAIAIVADTMHRSRLKQRPGQLAALLSLVERYYSADDPDTMSALENLRMIADRIEDDQPEEED